MPTRSVFRCNPHDCSLNCSPPLEAKLQTDKLGTMETGNDIAGDDGTKSSRRGQGANATDRDTRFWEQYAKVATEYDEKFLKTNRDNISAFMIVAGLFSAVSATFLVAIQPDLKPDPTDTTNALLMMLVHSANGTTFTGQDLGIPVWNGPSAATVWTQVLGYTALSASLLAALGAVLATQWFDGLAQLHNSPLRQNLRRRQLKVDTFKKWKFDTLLWSVPAFLEMALLLFSFSLAIYLWELHRAVGSAVIAIMAIGALFYLSATLASLVYHHDRFPFHTALSSMIYGAVEMFLMMLVQKTSEYWAWRTSLKRRQKRPIFSRGNVMVAYTIGILFFPLVAIVFAILLIILVAFGTLVVFVAWILRRGAILSKMQSYGLVVQLNNLQPGLHLSFRSLRDFSYYARHHMHEYYLEPIPDPLCSDARSIAWLMEMSTDLDNLMAAAEFAPDVEWPADLDVSVPTEHLYSLFVRSIPESWPADNRALRIGKAFIFMSCHLSRGGGRELWTPGLEHIKNKARSVLKRIKNEAGDKKSNADHDLPFILSIIDKLVSHKLSSKYAAVEVPRADPVSQPLLTWLLQPLEIILQMEDESQSHFFPEALRTFTALDCPKELKAKEAVQYWKTFEAYFNGVVYVSGIDGNVGSEDQTKCETDCLTRVLKRLKQLDISRDSDSYHHFLGPLTVLSRAATIPDLQQTFKDSAIDHWVIKAFNEAVHRTDGKKEEMEYIWNFSSCLMNMAMAMDALGPEVKGSTQSGEGGGPPMQSSSQRIDSKTLISYLLGAETLSSVAKSSEQTVYALSIVHANAGELPALASNPDFVRCILSATNPDQDDSVRDIGLKVLIAASKRIVLGPYESIRQLDSNLAIFIRRAFLHEDPSTILEDLLHNDNVERKASLLKIVVHGDPLDSLLKKLHERPNDIPEDEVHDLEIALVLSNNEGRKKLLFDYLNGPIARMPQLPGQNYKDTLALPLTAIIGWLLRTNGPLSTSEDILKAFIRPQLEELLYPAWEELDRLERNPKMLGLLMNCTERWLSIHRSSEVASLLPESTSSLTLSRLAYVLEQLGSESRALPSDIKGGVQRLYTQVRKLV